MLANKADAVQTVAPEMNQKQTLFRVHNFSLAFPQYHGQLAAAKMPVIRSFNLSIAEGEIVAVVGASGSGKSLLADAVLGILPEHAVVGGEMFYRDDVLSTERQKQLRGEDIAFIPQSVNALDPLMKTGKQVQTAVRGQSRKKAQQAAFAKVGLASSVARALPHELSGGMARRVLVSAALVSDASLMIADEPTPGLDREARDETLHYLQQMKGRGKGVMLITHDIQAALQVADRVAIFYAGETVEVAAAEDFTGDGRRLRHPYTRALWRSLPQNDFVPLPGSQPSAADVSRGCAFAPRCPIAREHCFNDNPEPAVVREGMVRCFHA